MDFQRHLPELCIPQVARKERVCQYWESWRYRPSKQRVFALIFLDKALIHEGQNALTEHLSQSNVRVNLLSPEILGKDIYEMCGGGLQECWTQGPWCHRSSTIRVDTLRCDNVGVCVCSSVCLYAWERRYLIYIYIYSLFHVAILYNNQDMTAI